MKILLALAAAALSLPVAADNYNGRVAFKQTAPKVVQDSVRFGVDVVLDDVALGSRTLLMLTPKLVSEDGKQTYDFPTVSVGGRNKSCGNVTTLKDLNRSITKTVQHKPFHSRSLRPI